MFTTIRYVWLTARRDKLFLALFAAILAIFGLSHFLGGIALIENNQLSLVTAGAAARVAIILGMVIFVCFHVRRAFDNHEIEYILTRPITRARFVVAYWLGFALLATILVAGIALIIGFFLALNTQGLALWGLSLLAELWVMIAFALFASLVINSAVSATMLCFGFYIISRMMGFFLYILESPSVVYDSGVEGFLGVVLNALSAILPRLDLYAHSGWLVYGTELATLTLPLIQTAIYIPLLLLFAIHDFHRRNF